RNCFIHTFSRSAVCHLSAPVNVSVRKLLLSCIATSSRWIKPTPTDRGWTTVNRTCWLPCSDATVGTHAKPTDLPTESPSRPRSKIPFWASASEYVPLVESDHSV